MGLLDYPSLEDQLLYALGADMKTYEPGYVDPWDTSLEGGKPSPRNKYADILANFSTDGGATPYGMNTNVYNRFNLPADTWKQVLNYLTENAPVGNWPYQTKQIVSDIGTELGKVYDQNKAWMDITRRSEKDAGWENTWMPYVGEGIKLLSEAILSYYFPPVGAAMVAADTAMRSGASGNSLGNSLGKGLLSGAAAYAGGSLANTGGAESLFNLNPLSGGWGTAAGIGARTLASVGRNLLGNDYTPNTPYKARLSQLMQQSAGQAAENAADNYGTYSVNQLKPAAGILSNTVSAPVALASNAANNSPVNSIVGTMQPAAQSALDKLAYTSKYIPNTYAAEEAVKKLLENQEYKSVYSAFA